MVDSALRACASSSIWGVFTGHAVSAGNRVAFYFMDETSGEYRAVTYSALHFRARRIADALGRHASVGARVAISCHDAVDFVSVLFGAMRAGLVAVPLFAARHRRTLPQLQAILADSGASLLIAEEEGVRAYQGFAAALEGGVASRTLTPSQLLAEGAAQEVINPDGEPLLSGLAYLQYTSGSTGQPKGVMISHENIMANSRCIQTRCGHEARDSVMVSWLPLFHDMGLVAGVFQPVFGGFSGVLLPPANFVQRPFLWLKALSDFKGTTSPAPNFAFDLCVDRISDAECASLDLSRWRVASNGAEPVRAETLERFVDRFAACGFRATSAFPNYGLAEATLMVTATPFQAGAATMVVDADLLETGKVQPSSDARTRTLVSCGTVVDGHDVEVVDPETGRACAAGEVGEFWIAGPSVAMGYWGRPDDSETIFRARIKSAVLDDRAFLRSGDLGFIHGGHVYVTGRLKDLIIVNGRNLYPTDIEAAAWCSDEHLRPNGAAAFAVDTALGEGIVVVAEVQSHARHAAALPIIERVREAVAVECGVTPVSVALVKPGALPRTTSGKVRHSECRRLFIEGTLAAVASWRRDEDASDGRLDESRSDAWERLAHLAGSTSSSAAGDARQYMLDALVSSTHDVPPACMGDIADALAQCDVAGVHRCLRACRADALTAAHLSLLAGAIVRGVMASAGLSGIGRIDASHALLALGIDSLQAMRVSQALSSSLGIRVSPLDLIEGASIESIAGQVLAQSDAAAPALSMDEGVLSREVAGRAKLTDLQRAYWIGRSSSMELGGVSAHVYFEFVSTSLNEQALRVSLSGLVARHEALRSTIDADEHIVPITEPFEPFEYLDWRAHASDAAEQAQAGLRERLSHQVLPAGGRPFFRAVLAHMPDGRRILHFGFDLLIGDVRSLGILFADWQHLYEQACGADKPELKPIGLPLAQAMVLHAKVHDAAAREASRAYWMDRLDTLPGGPELPLACHTSSLSAVRFHRWARRLEPAQWQVLQQRAKALRLTPSAMLGGLFAEVLAHWSARKTFVLNVTVNDRPMSHPNMAALIGDFTSVMPVRYDALASSTLAERLKGWQTQLHRDLSHLAMSGVEVARAHAERHGAPSATLAPVVFTCHLDSDIPVGWLGTQRHAISQTPQIWLDHQVTVQGGALCFNWDVVEGLFPAGLIEEMFEAYVGVLQRVVEDRHTLDLAHLDLTPWPIASEAPPTLPQGDVLVSGFLRQVWPRRHAAAVITPDLTIDYQTLYARAAELAANLMEDRKSSDEVVAIVMEKGWEQIVAVIAAGLAGMAYLPIDPQWPAERIGYVLTHCSARCVLRQPKVSLALPVGCRAIDVDARYSVPASLEASPALTTPSRADEVAYIIFTSGSTGVPKGVVTSHRGALNTIADINARWTVGQSDRVLALSALNFDLSVYDVFGLLGVGGAVVLPNAVQARDPAHWRRLIAAHGVTVWNSVPALMEMLLDDGVAMDAQPESSPLRLVLLSGDWIPVGQPARIQHGFPAARVVSLGGATEVSIWSIFYEVEQGRQFERSVPYGHPLSGQSVMVLDERFAACPTWVPGEIFIGGVGLANGYFGDEEKTVASFIRHPVTGERLYRTGDHGRLLPDGDIEFLGRRDAQVKVHGHRIELGEIESALRRFPGIEDCLALVAKDGASSTSAVLHAHIKCAIDEPPTAQDLDLWLRERLPRYMVPSHYWHVRAFPLTPNGKVDRARLSEVAKPLERAEVQRVQPQGLLQELLHEQVGQLLGHLRFGVDCNLLDLGFDSLRATRLTAILRRDLGIQLSVPDFLDGPTVAQLATRVEQYMIDALSEVDDAAMQEAR